MNIVKPDDKKLKNIIAGKLKIAKTKKKFK